MKNKLFTLFAGITSVLLASCGSFSFKLITHSIGVTDSTNVATITYPGSSSFKVNLYKVNGIPRDKYLERTIFYSYNETGSLGFSVKVPVGQNTFEIYDIKKKENIVLTLYLEKKSYLCDFNNDYKVYELDDANNKKEIPVKKDKVGFYDEKKYDQTATLHIDEGNNMPLLFRIDGLCPSPLTMISPFPGYYCHFNPNSNYDIKIPEGKNTIEFGITGTSNGPGGNMYFTVHTLEINAVKGKIYTIKVDKEDLGKGIFALRAHIEESK